MISAMSIRSSTSRREDGGRDLDRMLALAAEADIVVKHSGIGVDDASLERRVPAECSADQP